MKKTTRFFWLPKPDASFQKFLLTLKILTLILVVGLALPGWSLAPDNLSADEQQQVTVTGTVTDGSTGQAMPGVNIQVRGTTLGAISDVDGKYSIPNVDRSANLIFSFIGYITQTVPVSGRSVVDVVLAAELTDLDEVVVVGYSTQKRANVVGSVTSIPGSTIQAVASTSVSTAIAGRLPGAWVKQTTGEPGNTGATIRVRGRSNLGSTSSPLVVIDGVQGRSMDEIDPNDIASLSVLKDASAAIYGIGAANGVILITTKRGLEGKPTLNYQFYQGFMTPTIIPQSCDAAEYATMFTEYQTYEGKTLKFTPTDIELFKSGADPWGHPNTDWYSELVKKWTTTMRHNITINGGVKGMNYYLSLGTKSDDAMYKESSTKYKQFNVRGKFDIPITDWLKTTVDIAGFEVQRLYPYKSADAIVGQCTRLYPYTWAYWPDGKPGPDIEYGDNPVVTETFDAGKNDQKTYRWQSNFGVTISPPFIKGLSINGTFAYDLTNYYQKAFYQPWILYAADWENVTRDPETGFVTSMVTVPSLRGLSSPQNNETFTRRINKTTDVGAIYTRKFGDHNIMLLGTFEQYTTDYNELYGFRQYYISSAIQTMNAGADQDKNTTGSSSIYAIRSWIGRATYDFRGKYLAEFVFRRDGSLKWPTSKRWGNFPGLLLGWRASEEGFWQNSLPFINYLKLRASYGKMGMDPGNPFQYLTTYGTSSGMVFGTGSTIELTVGPPAVANPDITWETQTTYNAGFDSKWLNDLVSFNFDYFFNVRDNILAARDATVPNFTGLSLPQENIATVHNNGIEVEAGIHKTVLSDLRMDLTGNFAWNHNKVVFYDEPERVVPWQVRTGHPYNPMLLYNVIGVFQDNTFTVNGVENYPHWKNAKAGDLIFEDVSKDGAITGDDRILVFNNDMPEITYGANLDLAWKDFTLTVLIQGQGKLLYFNRYDERRGEAGNYLYWEYDGRWTPTNTNASKPRAYNRRDQYWNPVDYPNTYYYDNVAYCRLKNVILSYNIPSRLYSRIGVSAASIYLSGNNLALIYAANRKFDPEVNGVGVYPGMRTIAIGANITF
ncbi:MAG: TonB-dependent receptor [Bacteroidales bacterium]|nr:TonB-dependent receptor [Bacteroidales bacterium]